MKQLRKMMHDVVQWLRFHGINKAHRDAANAFLYSEENETKETYISAAKTLVEKKSFKVKHPVSEKFRWSHPDIQKFTIAFINECGKEGINVRAFEMYRTPERQMELYDQGVSNAISGDSPHQFGCAVDIISTPRAWQLTKKEWAVFGMIGKEIARKKNIPMTWGGDFKSLYDPAHWELTNWREYREAWTHLDVTGKLHYDTEKRFQQMELWLEAERRD
jgi:hypothetical protein